MRYLYKSLIYRNLTNFKILNYRLSETYLNIDNKNRLINSSLYYIRRDRCDINKDFNLIFFHLTRYRR